MKMKMNEMKSALKGRLFHSFAWSLGFRAAKPAILNSRESEMNGKVEL